MRRTESGTPLSWQRPSLALTRYTVLLFECRRDCVVLREAVCRGVAPCLRYCALPYIVAAIHSNAAMLQCMCTSSAAGHTSEASISTQVDTTAVGALNQKGQNMVLHCG